MIYSTEANKSVEYFYRNPISAPCPSPNNFGEASLVLVFLYTHISNAEDSDSGDVEGMAAMMRVDEHGRSPSI
ncbi:hypothetical protein LC653_05035 [Nostoc sp. CHAB 5784]|uniref:hypothetical protein n=1 Tax=Nostoc mirabile TaxID=2907820 RepID=UPI001E2F2AD9|nr:hypothetical protein [Nostoc mirabile]MCC5663312.1 hypothetical protein [Nostoc mirabile CHAB5784]